ncbi:MAG: hypothetical protein GXO82_09300 [Chlorobi bacterium]|nr:hypothetical protein [Chlorobiota bacterium]
MNPTIQLWPEESLEKKAYNVASMIPTVEPNDQMRLGYHLYLYLNGNYSNFDEVLNAARARLTIPRNEAKKRIEELLKEIRKSK